MKKFLLSTLLVFISILANAQTNPAITSWMRNTTNAVGYNNLPCNVQSVYYTSTDTYVSASDIPAYSIGPWQANPNTPSNQNNISKFTLNPVEKTGTKTNTGLGAIGIWKNGVQIFNPKDGQYWNNATSSFSQGITQNGYNRNALYWEGVSFDNCKGHAGPTGAYHHHISPSCLYSETASTVHSPIIGFVAQELELIVPELVSKWKLNEDCQDARAVDYPRVVVLLTEAIKEQQTQINDLKTRISILENK